MFNLERWVQTEMGKRVITVMTFGVPGRGTGRLIVFVAAHLTTLRLRKRNFVEYERQRVRMCTVHPLQMVHSV